MFLYSSRFVVLNQTSHSLTRSPTPSIYPTLSTYPNPSSEPASLLVNCKCADVLATTDCPLVEAWPKAGDWLDCELMLSQATQQMACLFLGGFQSLLWLAHTTPESSTAPNCLPKAATGQSNRGDCLTVRVWEGRRFVGTCGYPFQLDGGGRNRRGEAAWLSGPLNRTGFAPPASAFVWVSRSLSAVASLSVNCAPP
ncbi:hypothetical protein ECG_08021 [Echinococcus granulosus]|nr:hypothetical protein ECG_08021 [Echinococcus granulosus]